MDTKEIASITSGPLTSPADLIDLQEQLFPTPEPGLHSPVRRWAFRGQSQDYGTLVPSFQRIFRQRRSVGAAEIIEQDLIRTFREHYATLEGRTPDMPPPSWIAENYSLRCLSVMQHYGVPTRLLDWSADFWTSVYFACAGDPAKDAELWFYDREIFHAQLTAKPALFSLLYSSADGFSPNPEPGLLAERRSNMLVELDPKLTPRMKKQFAHHTLSTDIFADHAPLLFALGNPTEENQCLRRVLIAAQCKEKALRFLAEQVNITAGTIFPDVEGLGKFLHWHLESLVTTLL